MRIEGGSLVVVGGQNGTDCDGEVVSADLGNQTAQAFHNVLTVLAEAGLDQRDVAKLSIFVAPGARRQRHRRLRSRS